MGCLLEHLPVLIKGPPSTGFVILYGFLGRKKGIGKRRLDP
uniref:Uncharacterized protein n=1 Tax=uncultured Desulfobacterium sp. TaxID=201089 RepID=E1YET0_9BACT|nr:unknown protein [uncultured Desulfobacterium sp.]